MSNTKTYLPEDEKLARYAKALGHPARVAILRFLEQHDACFAGNIAETLPIAASTVSQHLTALKDAGLIGGEINPPTIKYCINPVAWQEAKILFEGLFSRPLPAFVSC